MKNEIYISGKITGTEDYKERFAKAEENLKAKGYVNIINPVKLCSDIPDGSEWEQFMKKCISRLLCDEVFFMKGWDKSRGAVCEWQVAEMLKLSITYEDMEEANN